MEVNLNTKGVKLVANNGERFARSLDDAQNKQHVVAYWRFEDHPVGVLVPESQEGSAGPRQPRFEHQRQRSLYVEQRHAAPFFRRRAGGVVPASGEANAASLDNSNPPSARLRATYSPCRPGAGRRSSTCRRSLPCGGRSRPRSRWRSSNGKYQVFVIRDGINVSVSDPKLPPLAFHVTPQKHFEILFCDVDGRVHDGDRRGGDGRGESLVSRGGHQRRQEPETVRRLAGRQGLLLVGGHRLAHYRFHGPGSRSLSENDPWTSGRWAIPTSGPWGAATTTAR